MKLCKALPFTLRIYILLIACMAIVEFVISITFSPSERWTILALPVAISWVSFVFGLFSALRHTVFSSREPLNLKWSIWPALAILAAWIAYRVSAALFIPDPPDILPAEILLSAVMRILFILACLSIKKR